MGIGKMGIPLCDCSFDQLQTSMSVTSTLTSVRTADVSTLMAALGVNVALATSLTSLAASVLVGYIVFCLLSNKTKWHHLLNFLS